MATDPDVSTDRVATPVQRAGRREWTGLATLVLPVLLISVDNTVLGFAVPSLSEALRPSSSALLWIIDIYSLMLSGLLVTMGTLGDHIGRRRLLLLGSAGFGVASVLSAYAPTAGLLIAARAALGVAGATLMPSTLSLIRNMFPDGRQRTLAIATWGSSFAVGSALGPILGGWLLEQFWWGSVFLINVPVVALILVLGTSRIPPVLLPESRDPAPGRYDLPGAVLSLLTLMPVVYGVKELAQNGATGWALGAIVLGVLFGAAFVQHQRTASHPMLDLALFANRRFSVAVLSNLLAVLVMVGCLFFATQYLQLVLGLSPPSAGFVLVPGLLLSIGSSLLAVVLLRRWPLAAVVGASLLVTGAGYVLMSGLGPHGGAVLLATAFVLVCAGAGITETGTNDAILDAVPAERAGAASAISETGYELGAALGTALLGSVVTAVYRGSLHAVPGVSRADMHASRDTLGAAVSAANHLGGATGEALRTAARDAFTAGVHVTSLVGAVVIAGTALQAWLLLRRQ